MTKILTILITLLPIICPRTMQCQTATGVPDTLDVYSLDTVITLAVLDNDINIGGSPFHITHAIGCTSYSDSTVTLFLSFEQYQNQIGLHQVAAYFIKDNPGYADRIPIFARFHHQYFDHLDINGIRARINSRNVQFLDLDSFSMQYEVPPGSGISSIYSHALWMGGFDGDGDLHLSLDKYCYGDQYFSPGPVSDSLYYNSAYDNLWNRVWKINRTEIEYHQAHWWMSSYQPPEAILSWPGNGDTAKGQANILAPFLDANENGRYEPLKGEYPYIRGDQAIFFIINDLRRSHNPSEGRPMGIEVHAMAYAFQCPADTALWYTTFIHYDIFNRSSTSYPETYLGSYNDMDLGYSFDDYNRCDVARSSLIAYNGNTLDGQGSTNGYGYGAFPPAISATILGGPFIHPDGLDNPDTLPDGSRICGPNINGSYFGDGIPDNERYGLSFFYQRVALGYWPPVEPTPLEQFNPMRGLWPSGDHFKYGGNGHSWTGSTEIECRYLFPGLSDPCNYGTNGMQPPGYITGAGGSGVPWIEETSGNLPYDRNSIISSGPFGFHPGESQQLDLAFVWARQFSDTAHNAVLPLLSQRIDQIREYWLNDSTPCGGSFSLIPEIKATPDILVYPNPAGPRVNLRYSPSGSKVRYRLYNLMGAMVHEGDLNPEGVDEISLATLPRGMYILYISTGKQNFTSRLVHY